MFTQTNCALFKTLLCIVNTYNVLPLTSPLSPKKNHTLTDLNSNDHSQVEDDCQEGCPHVSQHQDSGGLAVARG